VSSTDPGSEVYGNLDTDAGNCYRIHINEYGTQRESVAVLPGFESTSTMGDDPEIETSTPRKSFDTTDPSISHRRIGIWEVITMKEPLSSNIASLLDWIRPVPISLIHRFLHDIYSLNPMFMTIYMVTKMWGGIRSGIALNVSGNLLMVVGVVSILGVILQSLTFVFRLKHV